MNHKTSSLRGAKVAFLAVVLLAVSWRPAAAEEVAPAPAAQPEDAQVVRWYWLAPELLQKLDFEASRYGWTLCLRGLYGGEASPLSLEDLEIPAGKPPTSKPGQVIVRTTHVARRLTELALFLDDVLCTEFQFAYDGQGRLVGRRQVDYEVPGGIDIVQLWLDKGEQERLRSWLQQARSGPRQPVRRHGLTYSYTPDGTKVDVVLAEVWHSGATWEPPDVWPEMYYPRREGEALERWLLDDVGRIVHVMGATDDRPSYVAHYDEGGRLVSAMRYGEENVEYAYDDKDRVIKAEVRSWATTVLHLYHYPDGERPSLPERAWETVAVVTRDEQGRASRLDLHHPGEPTLDHSFHLERDKQGRLLSVRMKRDILGALVKSLIRRRPTPRPPVTTDIPEVLRRQLESPDADRREEAVSALVTSGRVALPYLEKAFEDENPDVRIEAAFVACRITHDADLAVPVLFGCLGEDHSYRGSAVFKLGIIGKGRADVIEKLCEVAVTDKHEMVRRYAVEALMKMGPQRGSALTGFHEHLASSDEVVRVRAAEALFKMSSLLAVEALVRDLKDGNEKSKRLAMETMGRLGPSLAVVDAPYPVMDILSDEAEPTSLRTLAAGTLAKIVSPADASRCSLIWHLTMVLEQTKDVEVRSAVGRALSRYGPQAEGAVPALLRILKEPDEGDRCAWVIMALGQIGPAAREAVPVLVDLTKDPDSPYRQEARQALARMGRQDALGIDERVYALLKAAEGGERDVVARLLDEGVDVNATNEKGETALPNACAHPAVVRLLIEKGADVNLKSASGVTPLMRAASHYRGGPAVELLLSAGADVAIRSDLGSTALHDARSPSTVRSLVAHGAEVDAKDGLGATPLMGAAYYGQVERVQALLEAGASLTETDNRGRTALHHAATYGDVKAVEFLIKKGADVNAIDNKGATPLTIARRRDRRTVVKLLLKYGATEEVPAD